MIYIGELTTRLAGDTKLVQEATGEKVSQFAHHMTTFLTGIIIGFVKGNASSTITITVPLILINLSINK
jgi:ATP-binding cassette subfamily B (MDR/TAP) protein 1